MKLYLFTFKEKIDGIVEVLNNFNFTIVLDPVECDVILAIGGDGTTLKAAKIAIDYNKLLVGYNTGTLGFLTASNTLENLCHCLKTKQYHIEYRDVLYLKNGHASAYPAINEIVISNEIGTKFVSLNVKISNTSEIFQYQADKVIFSTTTGSTAYNLSAGGSIVHPAIRATLITPVAPFSMSARPIILPDFYNLSISSPDNITITIDGISQQIDKTYNINIAYNFNYKRCVNIIKLNQNFFSSIQNKLGWGYVIKQ